MTLVSVIFVQIANVIGRRFETKSGLDRGLLSNRLLLLGVALELVFAWSVLYWPPMAGLLGTGPADPRFFALAALGAPLFFAVDTLGKRVLTRAPE
jgi:sodium/potassium-transporting ATPase subunit alpha